MLTKMKILSGGICKKLYSPFFQTQMQQVVSPVFKSESQNRHIKTVETAECGESYRIQMKFQREEF